MFSSLATLYGGIIFIQSGDELEVLKIMFFILIVFSNGRFLILWIFCVTTVYKKKRIAG
jgi:hypothetical protein